jgi:hypothetical protein
MPRTPFASAHTIASAVTPTTGAAHAVVSRHSTLPASTSTSSIALFTPSSP